MESPLKSGAPSIGHGLDLSGAQGAPRQRMVLMVGNLTSEQLARVKDAIANTLGEVQCATFPSASSSSSVPSNPPPGEDGLASAEPNNHAPPTSANFLDGFSHSKPALVTVCSGLESVCKRLQSVHKLENKVMKAVGAIAHYQKQQQDLADNFVRLSNKYQELKTSFHTVLWAYMPRLSEFGEIPLLDGSLEEREGQVGAFSVGLLVGKGHFAEVKVCSLPGEDRRLVIKAIDKQRVKNVNGLTRISHEIEALRTLRHPHILHLHSVLHGKQFMYLVTERLSSDLYEYIGEHSSGVGEVLAKRIISPILDAVLFMHARGFVHRDLKPENILLDYTGSAAPQGLDGSGGGDFVIKVCDFGLCEKVAEHDAQLTEFCGSPGFMAPEMVIERAYDGRKADVWSVGCILLELLLTAKDFSTLWMKNFQDDLLEEPQRFKRQLYHTWGSLEVALRHRCSDELFAFVCGLLKIDPSQRLSSADIPRIISPDNGRGLFAAVPLPPRTTTSTSSTSSSFSSAASMAKRSSSCSPSPCVPKPGPTMGPASAPFFTSTVSLPCASSSSSSPFAPVPKPSLRHAESAPEASNLSHSSNNHPAALHALQAQMQMQMNHSNNAPHHAPVPTHMHNNAPPASSSSSSSSRLSPTPVASAPCHPLSGLLSVPSPQPPTSLPASSSSSSASSSSRLSSSSSPSRPRPTQRHSSSARNSLRAQTLLKLESLSVGSHQYGRGRNRGLGPLSPGTPDVGIAKKFFEEDPQATASPATGSPCPGSPVHHAPLSGKPSTSLTSSGTSLAPSSSPSSPRTASPIVGPLASQGTL